MPFVPAPTPVSAPEFVRPTAEPDSARPAETLVVESLEAAVRIAVERSPLLRLADQRLVRTRSTTEQILAASQRPNVSAGATYTRLSGLGAAFGGGAFGAGPGQIANPFPVGLQGTPPGSVPAQLGGVTRAEPTDGGGTGNGGGSGTGGSNNLFGTPSLDQRSIRLSATQLVDFTGIVRTAGHIGAIEEQVVLLEISRVRQDVVLSVRNGWYGALRADALVRVAQAAVDAATESLRVSEAQLRAGTVASFDVLRAKTQLANNRQQWISARNQRAIALNALANTMGLDPSTPISLPAAPPIGPKPDLPAIPNLEEEALLARAMRQRPESLQADLNEEKAAGATRLARRTIDPYGSLALSGNYNPNPALVANQKATGSLSFSVTAPLYDGGATRASIESAHADARSAAIQTDQYRRGIKAEVQQAVLAVRDAEERARTAWAAVEEAREAFRLAGVRYREGVDTQLAVNDAQAALVQAETNAVNARYDLLGALARLTRAVGDPV
ncbi:MAG: TolC family protein [Armatimonadota bacterium]